MINHSYYETLNEAGTQSNIYFITFPPIVILSNAEHGQNFQASSFFSLAGSNYRKNFLLIFFLWKEWVVFVISFTLTVI